MHCTEGESPTTAESAVIIDGPRAVLTESVEIHTSSCTPDGRPQFLERLDEGAVECPSVLPVAAENSSINVFFILSATPPNMKHNPTNVSDNASEATNGYCNTGSTTRRQVMVGTLAVGSSLAGCLGAGSGGGQSIDFQTVDTTETGEAEFDIGENEYTITSHGNLAPP